MWTPAEIATLLAAIGSLIGVIGGIIIQLRGQTEARRVVGGLNDKLESTHASIAQVVKSTDGMKDALVAATAAKSHAEGVIEGRQYGNANPTGDSK